MHERVLESCAMSGLSGRERCSLAWNLSATSAATVSATDRTSGVTRTLQSLLRNSQKAGFYLISCLMLRYLCVHVLCKNSAISHQPSVMSQRVLLNPIMISAPELC